MCSIMGRCVTRRGGPWWSGLAAVALACAACLAAIVAPALGGAPRSAEAQPRVRAVATVGMITDAVRHVGGGRVAVTGLMGQGIDPHLYKASPGDVRAMADADVVFYNGLHLEGRMAEVIERMASRTTVVRVTEAIDPALLRSPPEFEGQPDPHVWFDVSLWRSVVGRVEQALARTDPDGADHYARSAAEHAALLDELHGYAAASLASVPPAGRVLVTAHDAFGYFGRAYGLEVLAIQGISTDSEASLRDINALVDTLVSRKVPAVFIESSVPRKTVDALVQGCAGRGHAVVVGGELFSDALGAPGTLEGTYVGMVLHNVRTITRALGGAPPEALPALLRAYVERFGSPPATTAPPGRAGEP